MSYWITKFRDATLPQRAARQEVGVGPAFGSIHTLSGGGGYDPQGTRQARRTPWRIGVEGTVVASSNQELEAMCGTLRALVGQAGTLYRTGDFSDANDEWTWARCVDLTVSRQPPGYRHCPMHLTFEVQSPSWYGTALITEAEAVSAGGNSVTLSYEGNTPAYDCRIAVVAPDGMSSITIRQSAAGYETEITYAAAIPAGGTLLLDCGDLTIYNNGTAAAHGLSYGANARRPEWFILPPGGGTVYITAGGHGGTVTFAYHYAYA